MFVGSPYDVCVLKDGHFVYHGRACPHENVQDEEGTIMPLGWTAQHLVPRSNEEQHNG